MSLDSKSRLKLKLWPPELEGEGPLAVAAVFVIALLVVAIALWLRFHA